MTVGAAGGLNVILKTLINPGDESDCLCAGILENTEAMSTILTEVLVEISPDTETFQPKLDEFARKITPKTKAVIVNNPNNPTGVVYSEETVKKMASVMEEKQKEIRNGYLSDFRRARTVSLCTGDAEVPFLTKYYDNTIVGYSFSKSLSLPGRGGSDTL